MLCIYMLLFNLPLFISNHSVLQLCIYYHLYRITQYCIVCICCSLIFRFYIESLSTCYVSTCTSAIYIESLSTACYVSKLPLFISNHSSTACYVATCSFNLPLDHSVLHSMYLHAVFNLPLFISNHSSAWWATCCSLIFRYFYRITQVLHVM